DAVRVLPEQPDALRRHSVSHAWTAAAARFPPVVESFATAPAGSVSTLTAGLPAPPSPAAKVPSATDGPVAHHHTASANLPDAHTPECDFAQSLPVVNGVPPAVR